MQWEWTYPLYKCKVKNTLCEKTAENACPHADSPRTESRDHVTNLRIVSRGGWFGSSAKVILCFCSLSRSLNVLYFQQQRSDLISVVLHRHVLWVLRRHVSIEFPFSKQWQTLPLIQWHDHCVILKDNGASKPSPSTNYDLREGLPPKLYFW